jgi:hypothetical protein
MKSKIKNPATISGLQNKIGCFSAVLVAGFLIFSLPAQASIGYTRTPAGDNPNYPVSFNLTDVIPDYCADYDFYGIYISAGMTERLSEPFISSSTFSGNFNYFGLFGDTGTTSTLPVGFVSSQVALACSDYEYPTEAQYNNPSYQLETSFTITEYIAPAGWFPADFLTSVNYHVNDFINDGAPAIILVIGLTLAILIINWLLSLFIRRKK